MKIVISNGFGSFELSRKAVQKLSEYQGRPCYFFEHIFGEDGKESYRPLDGEEEPLFLVACDIPNPQEVLTTRRAFYNAVDARHFIDFSPSNRTDPLLIRVVEEMGAEANGPATRLKVVDIPDDVEWELHECEGTEWIAEKHRTWS